ncbi:TetR/AcrR family transcriptional regulator [Lacticaseibacillus suihuaensis]
MGKREEKKQAKREEIFNIAIKLFDELGYDNVTTAQIAAECHIAKKTLFQYFASKEDIIFEDEDELIDTVIAQISGEGDVWGLFVTWLSSNHRDSDADHASIPEALRLPEIIEANDTLFGRLLKMWAKYQVRLTDFLVNERGFSYLRASALADIMVHVLKESFSQQLSIKEILDAHVSVAKMCMESK